METVLTTTEIRVLGCLIEKEMTTPRLLPPDPERVDQRLQSEIEP